MDTGLTDKKALVLASSRGLGLGVANALANEGAHVVLCGRNEERLAQAVTAMRAKTLQAHYVVADLDAPDFSASVYQRTCEHIGNVDILVNNCGGPPPGPITAVTSPDWEKHFQPMFVRLVEITNLCLPTMRKQRWGRIITLASSGVVQPIPQLGISNALRSALVGWSKTLANEVAGEGITVNVLAPGRIHTDRIDQLDESNAHALGISREQVAANNHKTIPVGRYGRVEEFAAVATFLASSVASYVTGNVIRCDGGLVLGV